MTGGALRWPREAEILMIAVAASMDSEHVPE
jgi:hypothetical protein